MHSAGLIYKVGPSVCRISTPNKVGTGFFIKLFKDGKPLFLLMSNEQIITKDIISKKEEIQVYYDNQKKQ